MRTSLLINCSRKEAEQVRKKAGFQRRTVSGYVINIVIRSVEFSDGLVSTLGRSCSFKLPEGKHLKGAAPRTALHIYCGTDEAKRIRAAAFLRKMTICGFVLSCLWRSWESENAMELMTRRVS